MLALFNQISTKCSCLDFQMNFLRIFHVLSSLQHGNYIRFLVVFYTSGDKAQQATFKRIQVTALFVPWYSEKRCCVVHVLGLLFAVLRRSEYLFMVLCFFRNFVD